MGDDDNSSVVSDTSISSIFSFGSGIDKRQSLSSCGTRRASSATSLLPSTSSMSGGTSSFHRTGGKHSIGSVPRWVLPLLYILTALSWMRAYTFRSGSLDLLSAMDVEVEALTYQGQETSRLLREARRSRDALLKQMSSLKKTQKLFRHEVRMLEELYEAEVSSHKDDVPIPSSTVKTFDKRKSANVAANWVEQRHDVLLHKIYNLQSYVMRESYNSVVAKYGPGPHQIRFTVRTNEGRKSGVFIVELAPLDLVPHSIEKFLDMVNSKIWDNTVFYSHRTQSHVIAAAPVVYGTFQSKQHQLEALGHKGTSFPEYSSKFPHKRLTLGFAGTGPNFYINAIDNSDHHGPGGQGHHNLPTDADPCFGHVVSGHDVVIKDMMPGRHTGGDPVGWEDFDVTRIVKVELLRL